MELENLHKDISSRNHTEGSSDVCCIFTFVEGLEDMVTNLATVLPFSCRTQEERHFSERGYYVGHWYFEEEGVNA
jgi:hypothetical protein